MFNRVAVKRVLMLLQKSEVAKKGRNIMIAESEYIEKAEFKNLEKLMIMVGKNIEMLTNHAITSTNYTTNHETRINQLEQKIGNLYKDQLPKNEIQDLKQIRYFSAIDLAKEIGISSRALRKNIQKLKLHSELRRREDGRVVLSVSEDIADILKQRLSKKKLSSISLLKK